MPRATLRKGAAKSEASVSTALAPTLARPGDPLVLPDGSIIYESRLAPRSLDESDDDDESRIFRENITPSAWRGPTRRALAELPTETRVLNGIGAVFMYTVLGVSDREIAEALRVTVEQVGEVRSHPAYSECFDAVVSGFLNANSDLIQARLAAYSHGALSQVHRISKSAEKDETRLRASQDILDRAGHRAADIKVRKDGMGADELRITIVRKDKEVSVDLPLGDEDDV